MEMKKCSLCRKVKEEKEYHRDCTTNDQLAHRCKSCNLAFIKKSKVVSRQRQDKELLLSFLFDLNEKGYINNHDFNYEEVVHSFVKSS